MPVRPGWFSASAVSPAGEPVEWGVTWAQLRSTSQGGAGLDVFTATEPGGHVIGAHHCSAADVEEIYVVVAGHAVFDVEGATIDAPAGTVVVVEDPKLMREATAASFPTTIVVASLARVAHVPEPAWEYVLRARTHARRRDLGAAEAVARSGVSRYPDDATLLYFLACVQAVAGRPDEAVRTLGSAAERDPRVGAWAAADTDLDSIRDLAGFPRSPSR